MEEQFHIFSFSSDLFLGYLLTLLQFLRLYSIRYENNMSWKDLEGFTYGLLEGVV
jgi:hypothetical protein